MYLVDGSFQNLTENDVKILTEKGFNVQKVDGLGLRSVSQTAVTPVNMPVTMPVANSGSNLPASWQDYTRDFNSLFNKKFTLAISADPGGLVTAIAIGGYYENDYPGLANFGYRRDSTGAVNATDVTVQEFSQLQYGNFLKTAATDVPTLAKLARFLANNPVAIVAMRVTSATSTQLSQQPQYFEKVVGNYVKENAVATVAKPAIITEQFQSTIANVYLPEPFIVDGSSFITYGIVAGASVVLEIAYTEVENMRVAGNMVTEMYKKYNKTTCM